MYVIGVWCMPSLRLHSCNPYHCWASEHLIQALRVLNSHH